MRSEIRERLAVRTPEGAVFSYRLASPALRLMALMIDFAAISAAWSLVAAVLRLLELFSTDVYKMALVVGYFVVSQGYSIAMEAGLDGQTLGKRLLDLRVVDVEGMPLQFGQVVVRNILRFVDQLPALYLLGGGIALASRRAQRLGDIAAGTVVIWERPATLPDIGRIGVEKYNSLRSLPVVAARLRQAIGPGEAVIAAKALARRDRLEDAARLKLFAEFARHFRAAGHLPADAVDGQTDEQVVRNVVEILYGA